MEEIGNHIFLEKSYAGVVLGAFKIDRSVLLVDSPLLFADQQSWREKALQLNEGKEYYALMLDTHIDRTIGLYALGGTILGHENVVAILANMPAPLRPHVMSAGSEVEALNLPINTRWPLPAMTFSRDITFYTNETPVTISYQPGAHLAGCWVRSDAEKVIFVGDSVLDHQPPFLAWSDLDTWLNELSLLQTEAFKDYRIVTSRSGLVRMKAIEKQAEFLKYIQDSLPELAAQQDRDEAIYDFLPKLLRKTGFDRKFLNQYRKRLAYGLSDYLKRHEDFNKKEE